MNVYAIRLNVSSLLYSNGAAPDAVNCIQKADAFVLALIQNPPVY
jgi:hypothetical protein